MAKLGIHVDDTIVTSVVDHRTRTNRDHVIVPLHHVAEWLVTNWHHLFHEIEDTREQNPEFEARHNLAFSGDGFVLPNLTISPASGEMNLRWIQYQPRFTALQFVGSGEARVQTRELEDELRALIDAVLEKLRSENLAFEALGDVWDAINRLDPEEQEFAHAAALLGVDPFDVDDSVASAIVKFWQETDPSLREDALAAANPNSLLQVQEWLRNGLDTLEADAVGDRSDWDAIRRSLPSLQPGTPWAQGYELARSVRAELGAGDHHYGSASIGLFALPHHEMQSPSTRIQGLVASDTPACVTTPKGEPGKRFLRARALGEYLGRSESGPSILSSLATDAQARSRAFAAELLAPAESVRERLGSGPAASEMVDELCLEFGVSRLVIRHQIENHGLARIAES